LLRNEKVKKVPGKKRNFEGAPHKTENNREKIRGCLVSDLTLISEIGKKEKKRGRGGTGFVCQNALHGGEL